MTRFHRKSRAGCTQCKRRRVKCDERRPSCTSCERHGARCSLEFLTPMGLMSRQHAVSSLRGAPHAAHGGFDPLSHILITQLPDVPSTVGVRELLHHYINAVAPSLDRSQTPSIWRVSIPQIATSHPFLLCGITAVSAMHLATLLPHRRKELHTRALVQENAALPSFRASINSPTPESIHATFAFSGSVVYYVMASSESPGADREADRCRIPSAHDKYPHWFNTMRGLMAFLAKHRDQLANGPFAPMLRRDPVSDQPLHSPDICLLDQLYGMVSSNSPESTVCTEAIGLLRRAFELAYSENPLLSSEASLRVWPGSISQSFMDLIYERDPRALVIMAHYCILLKRNDHAWYIRDLGHGMLKNILRALDKEWYRWVMWPISEILSPAEHNFELEAV